MYLRRRTPWDTGITPPEVMEFIEGAPPGKALDLGCGTGTNAIALARRGWRVTGVDFASRAIREARRKSAREGLEIEFLAADIADLRGLTGGYDYALDVGCLHSLPETGRAGYAAALGREVRPGGLYMLYAWLPGRPGCGGPGISPGEVESLLKPEFTKVREAIGEEGGHPAAWYWFTKR
jgi:SAM-dependent methyltransferase